jgi:hypothetical protein
MEPELKSKGEQLIEGLMRELDPASERYRVLATARRFKSTWVELGEQLLKVSRESLFRQWGYDSFEDYCSREIRIRRPTAQKLTLAYRYLEKEEPELLARRTELKPLPDYRSVDLLRQARDQNLPPEKYAELRRAVIVDERGHPTVRKYFRAATATPLPGAAAARQALQTALTAARHLAITLKGIPDLPREQTDAVVRVVALLEDRWAQEQED